MIMKRPIPLKLVEDIANAPLVDESELNIPSPWRSELSQREKEVLKCASVGLTTEMTADTLGISMLTAKDYRKRCIQRLAAKNMIHAVSIALREGIID